MLESWLWMAAAIIFEVCGTISMKLSSGMTKLVPTLLLFIFYFFSLAALTIALKKLDLSLAYTVWAGLGTSLIAIVSVLWFNEPVNLLKVISLVLVILGIVGLKVANA